MIADSWFGGIRCVLGLYKLGFQAIKIIKTGTAGYRKRELQDKLKGYDIPRGEHVAALTTLDGVKMIALACRIKYDNGKKTKAKKANFLSFFYHTVSPHYHVSLQRRNEIIQMGQELHQILSTATIF